MALLAALQFGDNDSKRYGTEILLARCNYQVTREYENFLPKTDAKVDHIDLDLIIEDNNNQKMYDWYIGGEPMSGRVVFQLASPVSDEILNKEVLFYDGYCYALSERYDILKSNRRYMRVSFTAEKVVINDVEYVNLYKR